MTARGASHPEVPDGARPQWDALAEALAVHGPAPCSSSPAAFWPDRAGSLTEVARQLCGACPIRRACGDYAAAADERDGVWAGVDRSRLTRRYARTRPHPDPVAPGGTS